MGLDLYPKRILALDTNDENVWRTHAADVPCPFKDDNFPIGMLGTCCALRGKIAAYELDALAEHDLRDRMHEDMTAAESLAFASELRQAAARLAARHRDRNTPPRGAGYDGVWDASANAWVFQSHSTFAEALAAIRQAADWYEKVARLGFGVHAWY